MYFSPCPHLLIIKNVIKTFITFSLSRTGKDNFLNSFFFSHGISVYSKFTAQKMKEINDYHTIIEFFHNKVSKIGKTIPKDHSNVAHLAFSIYTYFGNICTSPRMYYKVRHCNFMKYITLSHISCKKINAILILKIQRWCPLIHGMAL